MRINVVGAGPSGLYFALLMKRANPGHEITVFERNPPDATYGWGVVFSEETLSELRDADYPTFLTFDDALVRWSAIDICFRGRTLRFRGHGFSAIARTRLLGILQQRCRELGVRLRFSADVDDPKALAEADLLVGADGVRSTVREAFAELFGTVSREHASRYVWFGTELALEVFTFVFRATEHGLFQAHAYPFDWRTSTFIVETTPQTWWRAGLDGMSEEESLSFCEQLFAEHLDGHRLLSNASTWRTFATIRNRSWHHGNTVLMGDAAHTAHFSIGSGTKLAMEDAIALAKAFQAHDDLPAAFAAYELERHGAVDRFQEAASDSARYFEEVGRYLSFPPEQFAFNLLTRSGRITHANLELRDPATTNLVDRSFAGRPARVVTAPPALTPLELDQVTVPNRVVLAPVLPDSAPQGLPGAEHGELLAAAGDLGAGLVIAAPVAVSDRARATSGSVGCFEPGHAEAWAAVAARVRETGALFALRLSHAGRRGSSRPREHGLDWPLRAGRWRTVAASAIPYGDHVPAPDEADERARGEVCAAFAAAAELAAGAGVDALFLDCADGHLLASFLSPLANQRSDGYGGSLEARLRFPLEVLTAVRRTWPWDRLLAVRLVADDRHRDGHGPAEGVRMARAFASEGVALVDVAAGMTVAEGTGGDYRRLYQVGLADRIRNDAGVAALASGRITTLDEISTVVAAGRADLCVLDPRRYR